jgi:hypothetical protein
MPVAEGLRVLAQDRRHVSVRGAGEALEEKGRRGAHARGRQREGLGEAAEQRGQVFLWGEGEGEGGMMSGGRLVEGLFTGKGEAEGLREFI